MEKFVRWDNSTTAPINKFTIDPQSGFLRIKNVPITCTGVRRYRTQDGREVMEAKTPSELLSQATVDSANDKPITDDHPKDANGQNVLVNRDNYKKYMKGYMSSNAHVENGQIRNDLTITDPKLIDEIRHGKQELSIGFEMQLDPTKGKLDGVAYDAKQTNIKINHVAIVQHGRAGHSVCLTADSAEEVPTEEKKEGRTMEFTKVHTKNNGDISVAVEDAEKLTKLLADADDNTSELDKLKAERDKLNKQISDLENDNKKSKQDAADSKKKADESKATADSALEENKKLKSQLEGDAYEDKINETIKFREQAKKIVGDSYDFAGKSEREVEEDALKTQYKDTDFSKESDDYVRGRYESMFNTNAGNVTYRRATETDSKESAYQKALDARNNLYKGGE